MTYADIATAATDAALTARVGAAAAVEGQDHPTEWAARYALTIAASPGWGDAYGYAVRATAQAHAAAVEAWHDAVAALGPDDEVPPAPERPAPIGGREDVITDGMILSAVQAIRAAQAAPAPLDFMDGAEA